MFDKNHTARLSHHRYTTPFTPHIPLYALIAFSLQVDVSSRELKLFLASDNGMIMDNGDPPGIKREKRKKMVKVERVNFLGSEV